MKIVIKVNEYEEVKAWTVITTDEFGKTVDEYRTNSTGHGLWKNGQQIEGTCDYYIGAKTRAGVYARAKAYEER